MCITNLLEPGLAGLGAVAFGDCDGWVGGGRRPVLFFARRLGESSSSKSSLPSLVFQV